ncbi:M15 family metallopeptidase [Riemerella anatipestifer]|uniref:M15 family metallopeptidase n=1 Tax=Riemerella anatipestifer TaxID=34085 RepID=A0AAP6LMX2_RIEAN|nr:M15 family metallopeptidase [Riemerella anatipestifer]WIT94508.1 lysin [Riemerella phage vB_RanS_CRP19]MCU7570488.1 M15 family metallopeptidase [Riemerella anatipestifer]MCW0507933.1 M15 family metallopeptidase [Riemerella anatipestifer]MCW0517932.1 M15 family metallopeptidase [Riemerella anatipestifer]MDR7846609.1 M15 family metallopeptidase [Riemerella anatipestifer]
MDKITLQRIELLHPKLREEAKAIYKEICEALTGNAICRFTHTLRTFKEQNDLYAIGRTKKGRRVTNARGGQSYHNYGLAIDICLLVDKDGNGTYETAVWDTKADFDNDKIADWQEIVAIFKRYGWTWGGDWRFTDPPHFQKTFGKSIADLQELYNRQKTEYVSF